MTIEEKIKDRLKYIKTVDELEDVRQRLNKIEDNCNYDKELKKEIKKLRQKTVDLINSVDGIIFK